VASADNPFAGYGKAWRQADDKDAGLRASDPYEYWRQPPGGSGVTRSYWVDPQPDWQGMLTSEHIRFYHEVVGGMIRPFNRELLKPASYELTLGARYMSEGADRVLDEEDPRLVIPPNSIVFVSMQQVLCLPHYIVGRFDLAIDLIYQGLLLGTGPQVDPGFQGALSCPLHNISNAEIELRLGNPFAKIDFVKTIPRDAQLREELQGIKEEEDLARWSEQIKTTRPYFRLFKGGEKQWREPIFDYTKGKRPKSSVAETVRQVEFLRRISLVAAIGILLSAAGLVFGVAQLTTRGTATKSEVQQLRDCQQAVLEQRKLPAGPTRDRIPKACS
jgi:deoxycytidine triphosphate deaminase